MWGSAMLSREATFRRSARGSLIWVSGAAMALAFTVPAIWALSASLRPAGEVWNREPDWIPSPLAWENFGKVFDLLPALRFALNSFAVVAVAVPATIVFASLAGFAIAQMSRVWRMRMIGLAVLCLMVPITAVWIPRFMLYKEAGLIDRRVVLMVPALMGTSPLYVMLFIWAFTRIPRDQFDAARLDGAGAFRIWREIAMPLARSTVVAVGVLASVYFWNAFIEPLLYIRTMDKYVASQGLRMLYQLDTTNWSLIMAGALLMIAPVFLLFVLAQRAFMQDARGQSVLGR